MATIHDNDAAMKRINDYIKHKMTEVSLVAEAKIDPKNLLLALKMHTLAHRQFGHDDGRKYNQLYGFTLVAAIVDVAKRRYEKGGLWPYLNEELREAGVKRDLDQLTQKAWREVFIGTLRGANLPTVGDGYELVDTAAMHAGIPTYCLDDWFNLTGLARRRVGNYPAEMTHWSIAHQDAACMQAIDKPIKRMLVYGPEFAEDLFERAAELTDELFTTFSKEQLKRIAEMTADDLQDHPAVQIAQALGLSSRWAVMGARNLSASDENRRTATSVGQEPILRPKLRLDMPSGQIELTVPAIMNVWDPVEWRITIGDRDVVRVADLDTTGAACSTKQLTVPVLRPARTLGLSVKKMTTWKSDAALSNATQQNYLVELWPVDHPAAFFSASGTHRPTSAGVIPPGITWILLPESAVVSIDGTPIEPRAQDDPPMGWGGWHLVQYDFAPWQVVNFTLDQKQFSVRVKGGQLPTIELTEPVAGVRHFGQPVISQRPTLSIPPHTGPWRVAVTRHEDGVLVWSEEVTDNGDFTIMKAVPGLAGYFDLTVRGPLGRNIRESFALVDGLQVQWSPPHRRLDQTGLLGIAHCSIAAGIGLTPDPHHADLTSSVNFADVLVHQQSAQTFPLRCFSPATLVGIADEQDIVRWGPRPVNIDTDRLAEIQWIYVRQPAWVLDSALNVVAGGPESAGYVVQTVASKPSLGAARYSLTALTDTAREHGMLRLFLADGQAVGAISPAISQVSLDLAENDTVLVVSGASGPVTDIEVWCWWSAAPWREPKQLTATAEGVIALPPDMQGAGALKIHTRVADAWVETPPPDDHAPRTHIDAPGSPRYSASEQRILAVAHGDSAELDPADAITVIAILKQSGWLYREYGSEARIRLRLACEGIGAALVAAFVDQVGSTVDVANALVSTGLLWQHPDLDLELITDMWNRSPQWAASLAAGDLYISPPAHPGHSGVPNPGLLMRPAKRRVPVGQAEEWRHTSSAIFGACYLEHIDQSHDSLASTGYFDEQAGFLDHMPPDQFDMVIAALRLVPKAQLDADSRTQRVVTLAKDAKDGRIGFLPNLQSLVGLLRPAVIATDLKHQWPDVEKIYPKSGFQRLQWIPPFVRAAALWARATRAPAGERDDGPETQLQRDAQLALEECVKYCPELVLAELIRAEALHAKSSAMAFKPHPLRPEPATDLWPDEADEPTPPTEANEAD